MPIFGSGKVNGVIHSVNKLIQRMNSQWLVGAIDAGTTSTRMIIYNQNGEKVCSYQVPMTQYSPKEGWAEHDPSEINQSVDLCMEKCGEFLEEKGILNAVKCIGLATHRESTVAFDAFSGNLLSRMILWLDTRTKDILSAMEPIFSENKVKHKTGLIPSTYFSSLKMKWILENVENRENIKFATPDAWIIKHLTGRWVTDITNASRTMLLDINNGEYDECLLNIHGISSCQLPKVAPSKSVFGNVLNGQFKGVPITAVLGDQQASLYGQDCTQKGDAKCTLGTGAFILVNTGSIIVNIDGFISTIVADNQYAVEAPIAMAASGLNWCSKVFGELIDSDESNGVLFVPALSGLLAPRWKPNVSGSFRNLTLTTTMSNMRAAVFESVAFSVAECIEAISSHIKLSTIKVDGGVSNNVKLLHMISDCAEINILSSDNKEFTSYGVARAAASTMGLKFKRYTESSNYLVNITPNPNEDLIRRFQLWKKVVSKSIQDT
jgi:glycerol kinase